MRLLFIHALSPLHPGTGLSEGAIELAIARDRATGHPYLPGSSIKGPLRDRASRDKNERAHVAALFGPETARASDHAGALVFGDANLLLLPVRSVAGTFAWVTSAYLLRRFARDCAEAGIAGLPAIPSPAAKEQCLTMRGSPLRVSGAQPRVVFEDLDLTPHERVQGNVDEVQKLSEWIATRLFPNAVDVSWRAMLTERLCIVHDDIMTFFSRHAMDVVARVALKSESKTVDNLWHEESLPTESVLVSVVEALPNSGSGARTDAAMLDTLARVIRPTDTNAGVVQLGGKSTVGRGRCRLVLTGA